jgi:hypothetical protein
VFVERFGSGEGCEAEEAWGVLPECELVTVVPGGIRSIRWMEFGGYRMLRI